MKNYPKYVTREAIESLVIKLSLLKLGLFTQDWEYEVADETRINEFLTFYENLSLNEEEKLLLKDIAIHTSTILYWSLESEYLEDCFAITPFIRCVKEMI